MEKKDQHVLAIISLVLGILNLCAWFLPICGLPLSIVGIVLGILGLNSSQRGMAIAGIVLCALGFLAALANALLGAYLGLSGVLFQQQGW